MGASCPNKLRNPSKHKACRGNYGSDKLIFCKLNQAKCWIYCASPRRSDTYMVAQDELGYWLVSEVVIPFEGVI
jgi:hypothetical protein